MPFSKVSGHKVLVWLFVTVPFASFTVIVSTLLIYGYTDTGMQLASRYTVRVSLPLFLLAYSASALAHFFPTDLTRWLRRNRRYIGINFAIAHFIHMATFLTFLGFFEIEDVVTDPAVLLGSGLAYTFIAVMAFTSNNWSQRVLGAKWLWLHRVGIHYIWVIFTITYLGRLADPEMVIVGLIGTGLLVLAAGLRLVVFVARRRKRL